MIIISESKLYSESISSQTEWQIIIILVIIGAPSSYGILSDLYMLGWSTEKNEKRKSCPFHSHIVTTNIFISKASRGLSYLVALYWAYRKLRIRVEFGNPGACFCFLEVSFDYDHLFFFCLIFFFLQIPVSFWLFLISALTQILSDKRTQSPLQA